jgi:hypothetical protein
MYNIYTYTVLQTGSGKGTVSSSLGSLLPDDDNKHPDVKTEDVSTCDDAGDDMLSMTPEKAATVGSMVESSGEEAAAAKSVTASAVKKAVEPETGTAKSVVEIAAKEVVGVSSAKSAGDIAAKEVVGVSAARGEATTGQKKTRMRSFPDRNSSSSSLGFVSRFNSSASAPVSENEVIKD